MGEESEPMPDPELLKQYRELVTTDEYSWSSIRDLACYLRRQPPQSEDAVKVGDLILKMSESVREQLDPHSEEYIDSCCRCSQHMGGVTAWYKLAIMLNPDNPTPYERLARRVWWEDWEWPGTTLEPLARGNYDEATLKRVMGQYQKEDSELVKQIQEAMNSM